MVKCNENYPHVVSNERDMLKRFQHRTPYLRPLLDEIEDVSLPLTIVLRHLKMDLSEGSEREALSRKELRTVARRVLEALEVLHAEDFVHAGEFVLPTY